MITATQAERRTPRDAGRTAMAKPFGRYTPEVQQPVRQLEVKGNEKQILEQTREMLRNMSPEQVKQIIEWHKGLTVFEALILAKKQGYLIVPNDVHDRILNETNDEPYLQKHYPAWTGTFAIHKAPNRPLGKRIVFTWKHNKIQYKITFDIPKKFQGKKNCALVIEHPDFDLVDLGNNKYEVKVADKNNIHLIKKFPKKEGWYLTDDKCKIPTRPRVSDKNARYLRRINNRISFGPVGRGGGDFVIGYKRRVDTYWHCSVGSGVAMVPLAAASKEESKSQLKKDDQNGT